MKTWGRKANPPLPQPSTNKTKSTLRRPALSTVTALNGFGKRSPAGAGAVAVFAALCLAFSLWAVTPLPGSLHWLKRQLDGYAAEAEQLQLELEHLRERHVQLNNELTRAEEQPRRTLAASEQVTDGPTQPLPETRPESTGPFPTAPAPVSTHPNPGYVVRTGDTLWSISERLLGDPHAFWRLVELNDINDPDLILPGWQLTLPDGQERP